MAVVTTTEELQNKNNQNTTNTYTPKGTYNDAILSDADKAVMALYQQGWKDAQANGNREMMDYFHHKGEELRAGYGYSGGVDGSEYIPLEIEGLEGTKVTPIPHATSQESYVNTLYDKQKESALAELKAAYDQNVIDTDAAAAKIPQVYFQSRNKLAADAAVNQANFNEVAAATGLANGSAGQAKLAMNNQLQSGMSGLAEAEANALAEVETERLRIKTKYQNDVAQAIADGDLERAKALYAEAVRVDESIVATAYQNAMLQYQYAALESANNREDAQLKAQLLASIGDYSGYGYTGLTSDQIAALGNAFTNSQQVSTGNYTPQPTGSVLEKLLAFNDPNKAHDYLVNTLKFDVDSANYQEYWGRYEEARAQAELENNPLPVQTFDPSNLSSTGVNAKGLIDTFARGIPNVTYEMVASAIASVSDAAERAWLENYAVQVIAK